MVFLSHLILAFLWPLNDPNVHLLDFIVNFLFAMKNGHEQMSKCVQLIPWNIA